MSALDKIILAVAITVALIPFLYYWIYHGVVRKRWSTVGNKRIWLYVSFVMAVASLAFAPGLGPKLVVFTAILIPGIIAGHFRAPSFVPDNRKLISDGKNAFEKVIIFLWW
jgi:hypothetical protein